MILRFRVVEEAYKRQAVAVEAPARLVSEYYGKYVFDRKTMNQYLSKETMRQICDVIDKGVALDREIANHVAAGMKMWALEMGATHYSHWFHPLTGGTAEKHDSFIEMDESGGVIEELSGKLLIQQEPDASSFPSGGIRNTFEARGYTAWDPSSPAFVLDDTLCIPTVFISYTGESLDYKTPLLKAINAMDRAATGICRYFDPAVGKVKSYLGWEQEFFLIDYGFYASRPDLMLTGRTLMGHKSAKNQQLEDHYFGSIPTRVIAFMRDVEFEAYKYGIPIKTRHNEAAPNQFEFAPIYEEMNLANDHNQLLLSLMKKVARRHHFRVLLHEKPFAGVNGSGKHCNWSLGTDSGIGLFTPGETPTENLRFITFLVNVLKAVHQNDRLLKASIMTGPNTHRLGANEAPPAIVSVFLGSQLSALLDQLETSNSQEAVFLGKTKTMNLGVASLPGVLIDNTDRNRTSPFAFTGNRFEFRAVGSSANCASAMIALTTAVAFQLQQFKRDVDSRMESGISQEKAIFDVLQQYIKESKPIRYDGNGYSEDWRKEAKRRGLDDEACVPLVYDAYTSPETVRLFSETHVLSEKELIARNEVMWDIFIKKVQIESRVLGDLAMNHIVPVAIKYQSSLLESVSRLKNVFSGQKLKQLETPEIEMIEQIGLLIGSIRRQTEEMISARIAANKIENERERAIAYSQTVAPLVEMIRENIDELELIVDDELWTLPKYREMLFVR